VASEDCGEELEVSEDEDEIDESEAVDEA